MIGHLFAVRTRPGEELQTIANRYDVGINEIIDANLQAKMDRVLTAL